VQLSKDDVLVVVHDSDFSRLGGVAKRVWDLTYDEIRAIPLGGVREFTPTFEELLAETKGRIKLNIELKYYGDHQPGLARKVVEALRRRGMLDQAVIQCLEYEPLLEVRRLAPEVPIGYLLSFNARKPSRLNVNFLQRRQNRLATGSSSCACRGSRFAWTVSSSGCAPVRSRHRQSHRRPARASTETHRPPQPPKIRRAFAGAVLAGRLGVRGDTWQTAGDGGLGHASVIRNLPYDRTATDARPSVHRLSGALDIPSDLDGKAGAACRGMVRRIVWSEKLVSPCGRVLSFQASAVPKSPGASLRRRTAGRN
jgi:hypothetical protein